MAWTVESPKEKTLKDPQTRQCFHCGGLLLPRNTQTDSRKADIMHTMLVLDLFKSILPQAWHWPGLTSQGSKFSLHLRKCFSFFFHSCSYCCFGCCCCCCCCYCCCFYCGCYFVVDVILVVVIIIAVFITVLVIVIVKFFFHCYCCPYV